MKVIARAKVNLFLRVIDRRDDGFHEIESVMQSIDLFDELTMYPAEETRVSLAWAPGINGPLPESPDLVEKAIGIFGETLRGVPATAIDVLKRIPIGGGLGGGSADAAAAILGINELVGRKMTARQMMEIAARVGSDVPFTLQGGTAIGLDRGQKVSAEPCPRPLWWVIGISSPGLDTSAVYETFDESSKPSEVEAPPLLRALKDGDIEGAADFLHNDLEVAAFELDASLIERKKAMLEAGAMGAVMSGSGSSICGLCAQQAHALAVSKRLEGEFDRLLVAASAARGAQVVI